MNRILADRLIDLDKKVQIFEKSGLWSLSGKNLILTCATCHCILLRGVADLNVFDDSELSESLPLKLKDVSCDARSDTQQKAPNSSAADVGTLLQCPGTGEAATVDLCSDKIPTPSAAMDDLDLLPTKELAALAGKSVLF